MRGRLDLSSSSLHCPEAPVSWRAIKSLEYCLSHLDVELHGQLGDDERREIPRHGNVRVTVKKISDD